MDSLAVAGADYEQNPTQSAHTEGISAWITSICDYFALRQRQYLASQQPDIGSRLSKAWVALLLGQFQLDQQQYFYNV